MPLSNKKYWIIGASSGIGAALATELSKRGASVMLSARRAEHLEKVSTSIQNAEYMPCNVIDSRQMDEAAATLISKWKTLDGVIILSAIYEPMSFSDMNTETAANIVQSNISGTINTIHAVLPHLRIQKFGQIVLCGSIAGYRGLPHAQPYSATKAAIINLAESLRAEEGRNGIDVRLISPGFVKTPMTDKNSFPMPFIIEADEAAAAIADGLEKTSFEIHFPKKLTWIMKLLKLLPDKVFFSLAQKLN